MTIYDDIRTKAAEIATVAAEIQAAADVADAMHTTAARDLDTALNTIDDLTAERDDALNAVRILTAELEECRGGQEPIPPAPAAKIGAAFKAGESLPAVVSHIDAHRYFFQRTDFAAAETWTGQPPLVKAHDQYGARVFILSFKPTGSGSTPFSSTVQSRIGAFLDTIPADVPRENVKCVYWHEHEDDIRSGALSVANYRIGSKIIADLAHSRGMHYGPIHNGVTFDASKPDGQKWGLFPANWAAAEADTSLYDFWGADCYSEQYEDPSPRMDVLKTYADSLGLPLLIGELGAPTADPARQGAWTTKAREWALANTRWASYWSSQVTGDTDFRLTDAGARGWFAL